MAKPNEVQAKAGKVAASFQLSEEFNPWVLNGNLQTILGAYLKETLSYVPRWSAFFTILRAMAALLFQKSEAETIWTKRERIETPDDDFFEADSSMTAKSPDTAPWVIICHGLESSAASDVSQDMAKAYNKIGMNCVCLNYRTCSGAHNRKLGCYHFGFTDDLQHYINLLRNERGYKGPIYLSGFSLGANLVSQHSLREVCTTLMRH